jgi:hypothetical protein
LIIGEKKLSEKLPIKSKVIITVRDVKTKKVKEVKKFSNIITNDGIKMIRNWFAGVTSGTDPDFHDETRITALAVGDGNSTPAVSQTALDNELLRKTLHPTPDANCEIDISTVGEVTYTILIDESELNGETLREMALFSENFTDFMFSRLLIGNLSKTSDVQFEIDYTYTIG